MKILLVNKYFNMHGGSETYFFGLADLLRQAGHEVIFFAMQDEKNLPCEQSAYFVSNVEFNGELTAAQKLKAAFRMVYSFEAKKKISALIEKEKPDIIHINLFHRVLTASIVDAAKSTASRSSSPCTTSTASARIMSCSTTGKSAKRVCVGITGTASSVCASRIRGRSA